jgi:hypothetical protein
MEKKDEEKFAIAMAKTRVTLPGINLDPKEQALRMQVFWEELYSYSIETVEKALSRARRELTYFPEPGKIITFIREEAHEKASLRKRIDEKSLKPPSSELQKLIHDLIEKLGGYSKPTDLKSFLKQKLEPTLKGEYAKAFEKKRKLAKGK